MENFKRFFSSMVLLVGTSQTFAFDLNEGNWLLEAGIFDSTQGQAQNINIQGAIGDHYTINDSHDHNALFGLGFFIKGLEKGSFGIDYGINAFYFGKNYVSGEIIQEYLFANLAYDYRISRVPVYAMAKTHITNQTAHYAFTMDLGIGPDFIKTSRYQDRSLDSGITLQDNAYYGHTNTAFSAVAGVGLKINNALGQHALECGYRFFYLGEGDFKRRTDQLLTTLKTGNNYAQALMCSITV